jgi:hypothetical protein
MATVIIVKTTGGVTFSKDGQRTGWTKKSPTYAESGNVAFFVIDGIKYSFATTDTITVNGVSFTPANAAAAIDKIRDEVFN